ncbi:MAG: 3'-5' exonuclease [Candidatus Aenigmatarchaeota archaeon]|nr:MAG: 3'-5' exonuclease [Candidatus Aenigmarchaeota archaeon]
MIIVDIETTGLDPKKNSILSIGAMEFENPKNTFYGECRMDDGAEISNIALKINGFTRKQIMDPKKPSSEELLRKFLEWLKPIKEKTLGGENVWFDIEFFEENFRKLGIKWPFKKKVVELHQISPLIEGHPWSLDMLLYAVGIPPRSKAHNAMDDVELTAEAMSRLVGGKNLLKRFKKYPVPEIFSLRIKKR